VGGTEDLTFEAALLRLEEIVTKLDDGELSLEEAIGHFQEGNRLREYCGRKLSEAEAQVEELLQETAPTGDEGVAGGLFGDD
jgi:exodeoxyribonuclease VII small subunit